MSVLANLFPPIGLRVFLRTDYKLLAFYCLYLWVRIWYRIVYCLILLFSLDESSERRTIYTIDTILDLLVVISQFIYGVQFVARYRSDERTVKL